MSVAKRLIEEQLEQNAREAGSEEAQPEPPTECQFECPRCGHCCQQREWVGLTNDEIAQAMYKADAIVTGVQQFKFAKEVEVKLKEKNMSHVGCFSYPNCDINPNGCVIRNGDEAEQYGFKD